MPNSRSQPAMPTGSSITCIKEGGVRPPRRPTNQEGLRWGVACSGLTFRSTLVISGRERLPKQGTLDAARLCTCDQMAKKKNDRAEWRDHLAG